MPISPDRFPPLRERPTSAVVATLVAVTVIGSVIAAGSIARGGWWGWLGASFAGLVVAAAWWDCVRELYRRRR